MQTQMCCNAIVIRHFATNCVTLAVKLVVVTREIYLIISFNIQHIWKPNYNLLAYSF